MKYKKNELVLNWERWRPYDHNYVYYRIVSWWSYGCLPCDHRQSVNSSCLIAKFKMARRLSYYIIRYYLLTFLAICIAFIGFWLPINAWPARVNIIMGPGMWVITLDMSMQTEATAYHLTSLHWWMMFLEGIFFFCWIFYAIAIAWAHNVTDHNDYAKQLNEHRKALEAGLPVKPVPFPRDLEGYYFGNKSWFWRAGVMLDQIIYFFYGPIPYRSEPYIRNKVDYISRIIFVFFLLLFVFLYCMITTIWWSQNAY